MDIFSGWGYPEYLAVSAGVTVSLFFCGLLVFQSSPEGRIGRRFGRFLPAEGKKAGARGSRERRRGPLVAALDRQLAVRNAGGGTAVRLAQAGMKLTVSEYVIATAVCALAGFAIGLLFGHSVLIALVLACLFFFIPGRYVAVKRQRRLRAFDGQLGEAVTLLSSSVRAGYSILQACDVVTRELKPPIAGEFARLTREVGVGRSLPDALLNMLERVPSVDLDLMVSAINIQHKAGGSLAPVLDVIAETIRERAQLHGEIRVLTSQQRLSGYIVGVLPFALLGVLFLCNRDYVVHRLLKPEWTLCFPIGAFVAVVLALVLMHRIASIEV